MVRSNDPRSSSSLPYNIPSWIRARPADRVREKGDASRARDFLPADKQYLITRNGQLTFDQRFVAHAQSLVCAERLRSTTPTLTRTPRSSFPSLTRSVMGIQLTG
jgi:hypothetical protein